MGRARLHCVEVVFEARRRVASSNPHFPKVRHSSSAYSTAFTTGFGRVFARPLTSLRICSPAAPAFPLLAPARECVPRPSPHLRRAGTANVGDQLRMLKVWWNVLSMPACRPLKRTRATLLFSFPALPCRALLSRPFGAVANVLGAPITPSGLVPISAEGTV